MLLERENPSREVFDEAQAKIYSLMQRDSFPRQNFNITFQTVFNLTIYPQIFSVRKLQRSVTRKFDRKRPDRDLRSLRRGHKHREYRPPEARLTEAQKGNREQDNQPR